MKIWTFNFMFVDYARVCCLFVEMHFTGVDKLALLTLQKSIIQFTCEVTNVCCLIALG